MHADLLPVLAAIKLAQEVALSIGLQVELVSTSLQQCLRHGAGQARELAGPQGAFSQEIVRVLHVLAATAFSQEPCTCVACSTSSAQRACMPELRCQPACYLGLAPALPLACMPVA